MMARRPHSVGLRIALVTVLLLGVGVGVLLASPRHRTLYVRTANDVGPSRPTFALPTPNGAGASATPAPAARGAKPVARVPVPDDAGRVRVPLTDAVLSHVPAPGTPLGWQVKEFTGDASVELVRSEGRLAVRLRSDRTSFALHRDVVLDPRQYPMLAWSWKVVRLPAAGDLRDPAKNDQAAQVYVVFPRWPSMTSSDVLGYVWDSHAPVGTTLRHPKAPNVRVIVVESGPARLDRWQRYVRNVVQDYQTLFGRQPPRVGKVAFMIDTNDTGGEAEALFGELTFFRPGVASMEIPVTMLR
jgi:Protein of unknown function (DUF3047)